MTATPETAAPSSAADPDPQAAPPAAAETPSAGSAGRGDPLEAIVPNRREAIFLAGGGVVGALFGGALANFLGGEEAAPDRVDEAELSAREVKELLVAGNERYVAGTPQHPDQSVTRRAALAEGQHPYAAVLSCADSRVPPETLFDVGLGDLFVVRSAGQVLDRAVIGSLQYGVEHLKTPLLVVLGHSGCGAVKATVEAGEPGAKPTQTDIDALVTAIKPAVEQARRIGTEDAELVEVSVNINVERVVDQLKRTAVLSEAANKMEVKVIGAVYDLATGEVEWL